MKISTYNLTDFTNLIYKNGLPKDRSIFNRIRFFDSSDLGYYQKDLKPYFVVLQLEDKIIGLAKIGFYDNEGGYYLTFLSIDINYRNQGYTRVIANEMFRFLKENNLDIRTSSYTYVGKTKMQHILNEYANKYSVKFFDKEETDYLIDSKDYYDENLIHKNEKTI